MLGVFGFEMRCPLSNGPDRTSVLKKLSTVRKHLGPNKKPGTLIQRPRFLFTAGV